ncbi:pheromone A receptor-domain-containing protein, partial [Infundibulicybe gibba]
MSYPNFIYSTFAFIGFLFVSIPFPWHLEAWNTGTCLYMLWTGLACLNQFINSIVWNGNAINWAPKRRSIMVDLAIGIGLPVMEMILQYIPQGHRFNILEDVGCYPFTYNTPVAFVLVYVPPVLIGLVSMVYSVLSIRAFNKSRAQFKALLSSNHSNLNANRYFRLMCLAGVEVLCTVPLGAYAIYLNASVGKISPWRGWADTHSGFSRVDQIPALLWRMNPVISTSVELSRWLPIVCAIIFFGFFGFAEEARKNYRSAVQSIAKHVGVSTTGSGIFSFNGTKSNPTMSSTGRGATLPVFIQRETARKHDSLDS